jgi:DNA-binding CsgD family transcriptional regulator
MKTLQDQVALLGEAQSTEKLFASLVEIMLMNGYDKTSYGCATDCPSIGLKKKHGHASNFSESWLKHYAEFDLSHIDPVHIHLVEKRTPAFWSDCEKNASLASRQLMRNAADAGLNGGIIIPLSDINGELSMVSVSNTEVTDRVERYETLAAINLISSYFYQKYKSLIKKPDPVHLSPREYEILNWAAEGKTDSEIAAITGISAATVRYHWKNIFLKLDVYGRVHAVSKAVQLHLVKPQYFMRKK